MGQQEDWVYRETRFYFWVREFLDAGHIHNASTGGNSHEVILHCFIVNFVNRWSHDVLVAERPCSMVFGGQFLCIMSVAHNV